MLAPAFEQVVVDLARTHDQTGDLARIKLVDLADHRLEATLAQVLERAHGELVTQQTLRRHDHEGFAERADDLTAKHVEHLRRRRRHAHLNVVLGAHLQEALEARRRMLRTRTFISMRQQQREPAQALPLMLA